MINIKILVLLTAALSLASCSSDRISVAGEITDESFENKTVYLYYIDSKDMDIPAFLFKTNVEKGKFKFEDILLKESEIPTAGIITTFDLLNPDPQQREEDQLMATLILEKGDVEVLFDATSVHLSGTPRNEGFNKIHQAITDIIEFAEAMGSVEELDTMPRDESGRDGRAQLQDLNNKLSDLTFEFVLDNMMNNVGQVIFLRSYVDNLFTPKQLITLINAGSDTFKSREDVQALQALLEQMNEGLPELDDESEDIETEQILD